MRIEQGEIDCGVSADYAACSTTCGCECDGEVLTLDITLPRDVAGVTASFDGWQRGIVFDLGTPSPVGGQGHALFLLLCVADTAC